MESLDVSIDGVHFGRILIDPLVEDKLHRKHQGVTYQDVVEAIQWPAHAEAGWEDDEVHGRRVVAMGQTAAGRELICWLQPLPEWEDEPDTWKIRTARWV